MKETIKWIDVETIQPPFEVEVLLKPKNLDVCSGHLLKIDKNGLLFQVTNLPYVTLDSEIGDPANSSREIILWAFMPSATKNKKQ